MRYTEGRQGIVTYISVSIAFAKFVAIFIYQIYQQLKSSNRSCLRMVRSIFARYRRYRSSFYRVPVEMEGVATSVHSEESNDNDAVQHGEISEPQQLVLTFDENNEPFLRLLTEDNNNHAVHQHSVPPHSPSPLNVNQMNSPSPPPREVGPTSPLSDHAANKSPLPNIRLSLCSDSREL